MESATSLHTASAIAAKFELMVGIIDILTAQVIYVESGAATLRATTIPKYVVSQFLLTLASKSLNQSSQLHRQRRPFLSIRGMSSVARAYPPRSLSLISARGNAPSFVQEDLVITVNLAIRWK